MGEVRIATRGSRLAVAQAERVAELLEAADSSTTTRLVTIESTGDRDRVTAVAALTEMGAFVRSVQAAVLDGRADIAVHSLKDLPTMHAPGLVAAAYPERRDPADVLVGSTLDDLPEGAIVGTGSPRRIAQLRLLRPDVATTELRGNVPTRIDRVHRGDVDAAVLAFAGLDRLGLLDAVGHRFGIEEITPSPGQGTLVVETRDGGTVRDLVGQIDDPRLRALAEAERSLLAATGAGCRSALGALARWEGDAIRFDVFVEDERGPRRTTVTGSDPRSVVYAARQEVGL